MTSMGKLTKQRGLAVVELAVATPFLLVMLMVCAEFSRIFYQYNTLTKSVRDGARFAAEDAYNSTRQFSLTNQKITEAQNIVVFGDINGNGTPLLTGLNIGNVTVSQLNLGSAPTLREHIEVTANYTYQPFSPVISGMGFLPQSFDMNFTLTASSTMRAL